MAQCEAEGRKHPTMDIYVGIFNSKLYTSDRGSTRVGSVDKWSRHTYKAQSALSESFREDAHPSDRSSFRSRSFRDGNGKPPVLSDLGGFNRKMTSNTNVGATRFEMKSSLAEMDNDCSERKSAVIDVGLAGKSLPTHAGYGRNHKISPHTELSYVGNEKKSVLADVDYGMSQKGMSAKDVLYASNYKKSSYVCNEMQSSPIEGGDGSYEKKGSPSGMWYDSVTKDSLRTDLGHGVDEMHSPRTELSCGSTEKRIPQADVFGISVNKTAEIQPVHALQKVSQVVSEGALQRSTHAGIVVGNDRGNEGKLQGNGIIMKGQGLSATDGPALSHEAGLSKSDKARDTAVARRCLSSTSNEFARYERKLDSAAVVDGAVTTSCKMTEEISAHNSVKFGDMNSGMLPDNLHGRGWRSSSEINMDLSSTGGTLDEKSGESSMGFRNANGYIRSVTGEPIMGIPHANGYIKAGNVGEIDGNIQGNVNGLALKDSPCRGHNFVANLRVAGSGSTDSSSSHGGSSHSGSPTAAESTRDSRVSSFGNILISKGSPHSVSSRSMGSASISGNGILASSKSSFNDIPAPQFRYSTSSGRKSAEIVPNRRSSEMIPNRKSSEMIANGHGRGVATHGSIADGMPSSGNASRGSNGNNILLNNGNLLVGSANGNVLSVGGGIKSNFKQGEVVNHVHAVDCTLLKKAQASSDPEEIKNAGNEYYRRGHFSEALVLYSRAVSFRPSNAAYRSNRAAALSGLGLLGEAVQECEDAIRLDSSYTRAHQRVAALYLRLGIVERAKQHFHAAGQQTDLMDAQRLRNIDGHILRCIEARKRGDWQNVIRESDAAVVAGADSAPQIFGFKSEALLGLHKPDEADGVCTAAQRVESSLVKSGVLPADPFLLIVRAQVDMALGRFEGAVEAAKSAAKIDPRNDNVAALLRKAEAVYHTRTTGNELFKAGRFFEALALYAEGLESDPSNAVLLCNRAACRSKLGQWEKAVEDCDAALRIQPNYTKALMRRANCWSKLERWEDALQDYELLRRKMPEDLEVARGLFDTHVAIKKSQGEDTRKMKFGGDVEEVVTDEQFQEAISSPGLSVVQFITRWSERCRQLSPFVDDLCRRNPCVNFVKVDVEDNPYLAKIESVSFIPTFKIYKNGQKVKEILGPTEQSLEYALKHYTL